MLLSEIISKPFLLLDDIHNPYVNEELLDEWPFDDDVLLPVFEICKWGYIIGTLKPNVKCCYCTSNKIYHLKSKYHPYKCKKCLKKFNVFTDTIFNNKKQPFRYYEVIYDNKYSWSEIVNDGYFTNAAYYKLKQKFAFLNDMKFDNIFQKWQYLLNYNPNK